MLGWGGWSLPAAKEHMHSSDLLLLNGRRRSKKTAWPESGLCSLPKGDRISPYGPILDPPMSCSQSPSRCQSCVQMDTRPLFCWLAQWKCSAGTTGPALPAAPVQLPKSQRRVPIALLTWATRQPRIGLWVCFPPPGFSTISDGAAVLAWGKDLGGIGLLENILTRLRPMWVSCVHNTHKLKVALKLHWNGCKSLQIVTFLPHWELGNV